MTLSCCSIVGSEHFGLNTFLVVESHSSSLYCRMGWLDYHDLTENPGKGSVWTCVPSGEQGVRWSLPFTFPYIIYNYCDDTNILGQRWPGFTIRWSACLFAYYFIKKLVFLKSEMIRASYRHVKNSPSYLSMLSSGGLKESLSGRFIRNITCNATLYNLTQSKSSVNNIHTNDMSTFLYFRYKERAKQLSVLFHDRILPPGAELVHWVEYVERTSGATHLRSPAVDVPLYQKLYIDLIITLVTISYVLTLTIRSLRRAFANIKSLKEKTNWIANLDYLWWICNTIIWL